jgi:hypothetical protein
VEWYIYSKVYYSTVFDPHVLRHTESCTRVYLLGDKVGPNGIVQPHLGFAPRGPQNTAT